jgi:hypothetical protein
MSLFEGAAGMNSVTWYVTSSPTFAVSGPFTVLTNAMGDMLHGTRELASGRRSMRFRSDSMAQTSFTVVMLAIAGSVALLLGAVGIYGAMA